VERRGAGVTKPFLDGRAAPRQKGRFPLSGSAMDAAHSAILPVFNRPEELFVRGESVRLYTDKGEAYLDFIAGIAVNALGHANPKLIKALTEQAGKVWHLSNMFRIEGYEKLAARYVETSFADYAFFTNSGTEAVEGALKMARAYHFENSQPERIDIIGFSGSFHGRTYAAVNASGNPTYLKGFGPALPGYVHLPFGDMEALKAAIGPTTAAIIIEPVQGEGGCREVPDEDLRAIRKLCDDNGVLLIYDEVQCGALRTGKLWAHEYSGATPDIMATAKGIGGGFPLGALLCTAEAGKGMKSGSHGTTYGGNPLAMAVGAAAFEELSNPDFQAHVRDMANHLGQALEGLKDRYPGYVLEVRGKGLLRGLRLSADPKPVQAAARAKRLLVGTAGDNCVRLAPPLVLSAADIAEAVAILDSALAETKDRS
jgi:acetylornithine/N-succinyldiaminopimelate aminotransferase